MIDEKNIEDFSLKSCKKRRKVYIEKYNMKRCKSHDFLRGNRSVASYLVVAIDCVPVWTSPGVNIHVSKCYNHTA